jgi:cytidyltransferase-like protein
MTLADGCFDPLHVGHLYYLAAAKLFSFPLVVRVARDDEIKAKGRKVFQSLAERAVMLRALPDVLQVDLSATLAEAIDTLRPAVLAKGRDWEGRLPPEVLKACARRGTRIVYTDTLTLTSTERLAG